MKNNNNITIVASKGRHMLRIHIFLPLLLNVLAVFLRNARKSKENNWMVHFCL